MNTLKNALRKFDYFPGALLKKSVRFVYRVFIEPKSIHEDSKRHEFILNVILFGSIVMVAFLDITILYNSITEGANYKDTPFVIFSIIVLLFSLLLFISRKGLFRFVSYILILLYYSSITYSAYHWGVSLAANLLGYALVITVASILISNRFSFMIAIVISFTILSLAYIEGQSVILPDWRYEPVNVSDGVQYSIILFLIMIISWLSNHQIEKSLERAITSETELKKERDSLEIKVEERTKELKKVQLEKMSQLYRFAEFGRLSSGLFHDLISPLTSVVLNVANLKPESGVKESEITKPIQNAISASRKMENLIATIKKQIQTQEIDVDYSLGEELIQVVELLNYRAKKENISIKLDILDNIKMHGNPLKFNQVALNLISNSIDSYDALDKKSRIIEVSIKKRDGFAFLFVKDNGCGIKPEILNRIFDPLFTTKSIHKGTGLGLSITKTIVEKDLGGTIEVESWEGEGSTFTIKFPYKSDEKHST